MIRKTVYYIDRKTNTKKKEAIYGEAFLSFLYQDHFLNRFLAYCIAHCSLFSALYGLWQNSSFSKKKIAPFVSRYQLNTEEFELPLTDYPTFNAFFSRKLKKEARPFISTPHSIGAPAEGRYLVIPNISQSTGFYVKGALFSLEKFLKNEALATKYASGAMVIARLCPTDYHRFHFPIAGTPHASQRINGPLWSVNPIATMRNIHLFSENKRIITLVESKECGEYLYIEVGATNVGTITQTYIPGKEVQKGDEKGFFSFGGSSVILLFQPNTILFDNDLITHSSQHIETFLQVGESLGKIKF